MPLFSEQRLFGHVVLKLDIEAGYAFRGLAAALTCAVRGAELKESCQAEPATSRTTD